MKISTRVCTLAWAVFFAAFSASAGASTLDVPGAFSTIGAALSVASAGDTVLVQSGTYPERITLVSGVVLRGASTTARPVLDAEQQGVAVTAINCSALTEFSQFVVRNGLGPGFGGGMSLENSPIRIFSCRFEDNAAVHGGGLGSDGSSFLANGCDFAGNSATQSGGALATTDLSSPSIFNCNFTGNAAPGGGAVSVRNANTPSFVGCAFFQNTASLGGAIYYDLFAGGSITLCTIASNAATSGLGGSLFFSTLASPTISQSIVAFASTGGAAAFAGGAIPTFGCCDLFGNVGGESLPGVVDLGTNLFLDPLFCNLATEDLGLQPTSPCVNAAGCGQIGSFGLGGCAAVGVDSPFKTSSWGAIKGRYRP